MTCCGRYWSSSISGSTAVQTFGPTAACVAPSTWRADSSHPLRVQSDRAISAGADIGTRLNRFFSALPQGGLGPNLWIGFSCCTRAQREKCRDSEKTGSVAQRKAAYSWVAQYGSRVKPTSRGTEPPFTTEANVGPWGDRPHIRASQHGRLVRDWVTTIVLEPSGYGTHSMRRT
jgi:hypothetical protein